MTSFIDPHDRATAVLFGDGAARLVLATRPGARPARRDARRRRRPGLVASDLVRRPRRRRPAGGRGRGQRAARPPPRPWRPAPTTCAWTAERSSAGPCARRRARSSARSPRAGCTPDDVDLFVPHQANARIVDAVLPRVGIPAERTVRDRRPLRQHVGGLDPAGAGRGGRAGPRCADGDLVLMCGFGAGLDGRAPPCGAGVRCAATPSGPRTARAARMLHDRDAWPPRDRRTPGGIGAAVRPRPSPPRRLPRRRRLRRRPPAPPKGRRPRSPRRAARPWPSHVDVTDPAAVDARLRRRRGGLGAGRGAGQRGRHQPRQAHRAAERRRLAPHARHRPHRAVPHHPPGPAAR